MDDADRKKLQNNFTSLVEQVNIDVLLPLLYEKGVFSDSMMEPYRDTTQPAKKRKRELFRHIERRGPYAYKHLIDALLETGYYGLVRSLEPDNSMVRHCRDPDQSKSAFISLKKDDNHILHKQHTSQQTNHTVHESTSNHTLRVNAPAPQVEATTEQTINVIKSTSFKDKDGDISCYVTRKKTRGVCILITNRRFENNIEEFRYGADTDQSNLKTLFQQMGFHAVSYNDLNKLEMITTITCSATLPALSEAECLFVIIASHGYERGHDTDIRCSDGLLIQKNFIIQQFNNDNCPLMKDKPKIFIFQSCRGENFNLSQTPDNSSLQMNNNFNESTKIDGSTWHKKERLFSDILLAHSTIPGFVAHRDPRKGSWYIQVLCKVFAERAHDCHVEKLFTLVDIELKETFHQQTSSIEKWGFNKKLYLHPGLFEEEDSEEKKLKEQPINVLYNG